MGGLSANILTQLPTSNTNNSSANTISLCLLRYSFHRSFYIIIQLLNAMRVQELGQGDFLYRKGDSSFSFYFLLKGKIELMVESHNIEEGFKFSKNVDEFEFFGIKSITSDPRHDYAQVVTEKCWVLHIDKENYEQIVKRTQLSVSEQKIDFLIRYVPRLRAVSRNVIEELEVFFIKEVVTQGFIIQKQDEQDDYIYFVYRGRCRLLLNTQTEPLSLPAEINPHQRRYLVLGTLKRGDSFGEQSALNDLPNPYTVEAWTNEVHLYKILRGHLIQYFGGVQGDPVMQLRAQILLKHNWLRGKVEYIRDLVFNAQDSGHLDDVLIHDLEFRNEEEAQKLRPTKTNPKEVPFIKNNPRERELNAPK